MAPKRKLPLPAAVPSSKATKSSESTSLSPEQKERTESKGEEALRSDKSNATKFMGESWRKALLAEFSKPYFTKVTAFVVEERKTKTVYPPEKDVFSWTKCGDIKDVKVVIIGQDPYHGPKQAHGLCFSVLPGVVPPPSLKNIYKELATDIPDFKVPSHGCLLGWANQGVLLLNACLTVVASKANSHQGKGWEQFTDAVINWINSNLDNVVFILWGAYAQKKGCAIDKKRHLVLCGLHPSPLSAHRGFFGCRHFSKANEYLVDSGKMAIDWKELSQS